MNQFKYMPDDVEILVSASGKDIVEQRRERIQKLMEDAYKSYKITRSYYDTFNEISILWIFIHL